MTNDSLDIEIIKTKNTITLIFFLGAIVGSLGCFLGAAIISEYTPEYAKGFIALGVAICFMAHIYLFISFKRIKPSEGKEVEN